MLLRTIKDVYIALLSELNKHESPPMLIEDFNYFFNKAVQIYINKRINIASIGQQVIDDLSELLVIGYSISSLQKNDNIYPVQFVASLPENYFHLLRCNSELKVISSSDTCPLQTNTLLYPKTSSITSKELQDISKNYYLQPSIKRVYYQEFAESTTYKLNLYCGDNASTIVNKIFIDYFRAPNEILLTQDDIYENVDNSQPLEFKPYINQEILNELLTLVLENFVDPRLTTNREINQSIGLPQQIQATK